MHASGVKLPPKRSEAPNESESGTATIESKEGDIGLRAWHETCKFSRFGPSGVKRSFVAHCLGPDLWDATTWVLVPIGAYG